MDSFKSTELEELLFTPVEKTESDRQLEHNTFREMLASGFQRNEKDITINFGRRTILGFLEDGSYRDEITSSKIDTVMNMLAEDAQPKFLTDHTPFIEIKAGNEVLLRAEQNEGVTVNKFDLSRIFNSEQVATAQIEADSKLELTQSEFDQTQYELNEIDQGTEQGIGEEFWEFNSSVLKFGLYEPDTEELTLEFQSGKNYTYRDISPDLWKEFKEAESTGQFYNQEIKGQYFVEKMGDNLLENRRIELDLDSDDNYMTDEELLAEFDIKPISSVNKNKINLDIEAEIEEFEQAYNSKNRDWQQYYEEADMYEETITTEEFIAGLETESTSPVEKNKLNLDEIEVTKSNLEVRQQPLNDLTSEALEEYHELDTTGVDTPFKADLSVTVEIPFLSRGAEPQVSHPLQEFDTSSLKDFLNQEYQLTDQLTEIHRVDAGDTIDYEALKEVVEKAVENLYPEWDEAEPNLADEIKWYRMNERSRELQVSTDLILDEIDTSAQKTAKILNYLDQEDISLDVIKPPPPIQFQITDTGGADSHFLDAVQEFIKDETDSRVLTENTGLSPAQILVDEAVLIDPNISGHSQTQYWLYDTAQEINQDISQIRQDFTQQQQQQALVDEVAPQLVDILNELGTDKYQGKHRTIEFNNEQDELSLIENETGAVVMKAAWHPDEEKWEDKGSSLTPDDRDQIQEVAQRFGHKQKGTGLER